MTAKRYLSADEATNQLGISKNTLYSYVSRGLVRSEETAGNSRARRYLAEDIEALKRRKELRRNPARAAETAMHFGAPVLESAITLIDRGALYYCGHDALELARTRPFEEVAALLWTGHLGTDLFTEPAPDTPDRAPCATELHGYITQSMPALKPLETFQILLLAAANEDWGGYRLERESAASAGVRILRRMVRTITAPAGIVPQRGERTTIAQQLQAAWAPNEPAVAPLINAALILCADHELNVSAFTARCVASAESNLYATVVAGLAALQGHRHGGSTEAVATLFSDAEGDVSSAVAARLKRGEQLPGFHHPLYPEGDPRGRLLLEQVRGAFPDSPHLALAHGLIAEAQRHTGRHPNIDFALVTLARVAGLPEAAPLTLFALGRTAGWIGHAIEQAESGQMIRPRARYVGVLPGE